jgi:hypothetical protein
LHSVAVGVALQWVALMQMHRGKEQNSNNLLHRVRQNKIHGNNTLSGLCHGCIEIK